jgi:glycosyltransferase involved in cell wall biosynthesis
MSIYKKEEPRYFNRAMQSIWDEQTVKPNEIVLVQDGPLTDGLYKAIDEWKIKIGESFKTVPLKKNVGLGEALNEGIKHCSYELIARMDTDDISLPNRFEKQLRVFEEKDIDICSAWINEFDDDESKILFVRKTQEEHDEIVKYAKFRSPINHIPVMFKKSYVENAGGYQHMLWFEDYYLWTRLIMAGATFYNIQEPLANVRSGNVQLERRRGLKYAIYEFKFLKRLYEIHFLSIAQFVGSVIIRFIARILPKSLLKNIYKQLRK